MRTIKYEPRKSQKISLVTKDPTQMMIQGLERELIHVARTVVKNIQLRSRKIYHIPNERAKQTIPPRILTKASHGPSFSRIPILPGLDSRRAVSRVKLIALSPIAIVCVRVVGLRHIVVQTTIRRREKDAHTDLRVAKFLENSSVNEYEQAE